MLPALAATSVEVDEASVAALFEQAGVIRVDSIAQLFDTALLLAHQPLPRGGRVAIVGNSSAIGVLAADAALGRGLELAGRARSTSAPRPGRTCSPTPCARALRDPDVDALVVVFVPPLAMPGTAYARAMRDAVAEGLDERKPIVSTFLATEGIPDELAVPGPGGAPGRGSIPSYPSPERAVLALARATRYAAWRERAAGRAGAPGRPRRRAARGTIAAAGAGELSDDDTVRAARLLRHRGRALPRGGERRRRGRGGRGAGLPGGGQGHRRAVLAPRGPRRRPARSVHCGLGARRVRRR